MIEDVTVRWLKGEEIDPTQLLAVINARRREVELIGIDPEPLDVTPDLKSYLDATADKPSEGDGEA